MAIASYDAGERGAISDPCCGSYGVTLGREEHPRAEERPRGGGEGWPTWTLS
jgi:hypothetical protein